jgi:uncharacterized protein YkwD
VFRRSTLLRRAPSLAVVFALAAMAVPAGAQAADCPNTHLRPTAGNVQAVRDAILCLHNAERARHGLPQLRENGRLRAAARSHAARMVLSHFFEHTTPGGLTMLQRIRKMGYLTHARAWSVGENIAWGSGRLATAAQIEHAWMNSPGHRANILDPSFREIGIGIAPGVPVHLSAAQSGATYTTDFGFRR